MYRILINLKPYQQILLGLLLGVLAGYFLEENAKFLKPIGDIFIKLLKLIVVPLIFFSVLSAIISFNKNLSSIVSKTIILYLCTTMIAVAIGLLFANIFNPSAGLSELNLFNVAQKEINPTKKSVLDILMNIIPTNPFRAFVEGNAIQLILMAICFGIAINSLKTKNLIKIINEINDIIFLFMNSVIKLAPVGVFALIAVVVGEQDIKVLGYLLKFVLVVILACLFHVYVIYPCLISFLAKLNPLTFLKKIIDAQLFAFSTSSSSATLPTTIKVAEKNLGISKSSANFILPLGATVNMDGGAIFLGICTIFVAGFTGVDISFYGYVMIVINALLISVGTAGVPGASIILMSIIFEILGLPLEAMAIIIGVDRILDMCRTSVNVTGDLVVATIIDSRKNTIDKEKFNSR